MLNKDITTKPGVPTPKGVTTGPHGSPKGAVPIPKNWWQRYGRLVIAGSVAFILLMAITVYAMIPDSRPSKFGEYAPGLLTQDIVQKELSLTDDQKEKTKSIRSEMRAALEAPETKVLPLPERTKKENQLHRAAAKAIGKTLDAGQMARLRQLYYQSRREQAWVDDDELAQTLKLTKGQRNDVSELLKNNSGRGGPGGNNFGGLGGNNPGGQGGNPRGQGGNPGGAPVDQAERQKRMEEMRKTFQEAAKKHEEDLRSVLTLEQQSKWDEMLGDELKGLRRSGRGPGRGGFPQGGFGPGGQGAQGDPAGGQGGQGRQRGQGGQGGQGRQRGQGGQPQGGQPPAGQPPAGQPPAAQPPAGQP